MLNPEEFQKRFIEWVQHPCGKQAREVLSVDGKTICGSKGKEQKPILMVSAWANQARAVFGQLAVDGKTNEITAVPELLELLDIENTIVTADAMSCQKEIVKKISKKGADYVEETHYYISSPTDVNEFAKAARCHWGVENALHWCLDVTFREDHSRMRKDHSAENFAVVRHIVLNVLKNRNDKLSVARRRRRCAYDDVYLENVLFSIHA